MKNLTSTGLRSAIMLLLIFGLLISCSKDGLEPSEEEMIEIRDEKAQYIIVFHENVIDDVAKKFPLNYSKSQEAMLTETKKFLQNSKFENIEISTVFSHTLKGAVMKLAPEQVEELKGI